MTLKGIAFFIVVSLVSFESTGFARMRYSFSFEERKISKAIVYSVASSKVVPEMAKNVHSLSLSGVGKLKIRDELGSIVDELEVDPNLGNWFPNLVSLGGGSYLAKATRSHVGGNALYILSKGISPIEVVAVGDEIGGAKIVDALPAQSVLGSREKIFFSVFLSDGKTGIVTASINSGCSTPLPAIDFFTQHTAPWGQKNYDHFPGTVYVPFGPTRPDGTRACTRESGTISRRGCTLTALAMLAKARGYKKFSQNGNVITDLPVQKSTNEKD